MKFVIRGGKPLSGTIRVSGSKNAALPIIAATLLTREECVLDNVPRITDVESMITLLKSVGSSLRWAGPHRLVICNDQVALRSLDSHLMRSFRASILLIGPFLTRFGSIDISEPGGCLIGNRPLDAHFQAFAHLGVTITRRSGGYTLTSRAPRARGVVLREASVTATENILMFASGLSGTTMIKNAACEPHVGDLAGFLARLGCTLSGGGTSTITIRGAKKKSGANHTIIPDANEAGGFLILGLASKSSLTVEGCVPDHLDVVIETLAAMGARFDITKRSIRIVQPSTLKCIKIDTRPYPGIPTDLQSLFGVLATQAHGTSLIHDTLFEGRMGYVQELVTMGARANVCDPHRVLITGPTALTGHTIKSLDLRAGMSLVIAGLIAKGVTTINDAQTIDRGYERIEERLKLIGADIERIKTS